jgi:hypothetical protein
VGRSKPVIVLLLRQIPQMTISFIQHTTNPTFVEVGVEFFLPTDSTSWIPNGFEMVELCVDANEVSDDWWRSIALDEAAEQFCESIGVVFSQVIESDLW